jgi:hypothetical protein
MPNLFHFCLSTSPNTVLKSYETRSKPKTDLENEVFSFWDAPVASLYCCVFGGFICFYLLNG